MNDHEITLRVSGYWLEIKAVCNAPDDALCRNMPECDCESWDEVGGDEQGWFHVARPGFEIFEGGKHRHTQRSDCNICEWLNSDDPMEYIAKSVKSFDIASISINPIWNGECFEWEPVV
jgi:hypothetical protein